MALHQAKSEKLIFAPAGSAQNTRADQFTQHEGTGGLHRRDLDPHSPITQFHAWFAAAQSSTSPSSSSSSSSSSKTTPAIPHPETCTLSTAQLPSGRVSARIVYMKELDPRGFVIYSNFGTSGKARDLASGNPWAALTFWWEAQERQVRVEGRAERLERAESQKYFDTRVRGSRVGAWASRQSAVLRPREGQGKEHGSDDDDGREMLHDWVREAEKKFEGTEEIPVPEFWGGLRIIPERVEFWQGRENRLHDRFVYDRVEGSDTWTLERLSP
ncbi:pyridoxamine 5'-phosphate oxidase [Cryphonectria parasitica EP155]|uniref:pyridoxal 5'-phosphate synthase n=1 Tax=Cryphonectria parasitica (strain ATCC 38755 / EP155) TaxID=660469 RepID=A0A9P4Y704_CRYP1|nr:pyridoxamine 5'-phosphate oxidase [Cryphonectria parasitica EP155]KAF3767893.1 pyridoxamine 5'-phosphate oxidase [Cryphonectria parasitica EP155]